jgi:cellulose biosynthesis protein BcsQ
VLPTRYKAQTIAAREVMQALEEATRASGVRLFSTPVKDSTRFTESPSAKKPMVLFDPTHEGSKAYMKATDEILENYA